MKPHARVLDVTSTIQGEHVKMGLDPTATAHLMGILTDLYEDPEMAVIREYATNGYDAHIDAGVSLPIEVTLPTTLAPFLTVRDYGNGLDIEDIRRIYSQYGASTKRETNDQVGSLGLGCKSALTYTDQFTLQGIKNGKAIQVAISRDEDGSGSMTIVSEYDTDEPSGVEVVIPAKGHNDFEEKAEYLFQFWPEGSVLVNGEEPKRLLDDERVIELEKDLLVTDVLDQSVVVMGNVPYPFTNDDQRHFSVVAFVEMGAVQFTPSRESLQMTTRTKNVLADIGTRVANLKETAAQRIVDEAASKPEALEAALHASRLFRFNGDLKYKGKLIPTEIKAQEKENDYLVVKVRTTYYRERSISAESRIPTSVFPNSIFFTGFTNKGVNPVQREKIAHYLRENNIDTEGVTQYVLLNELPFKTWVSKDRIIDWEKIKAIKLPKDGTTQGGRPVGAYDVIMPGQQYTAVVEAKELVAIKDLYWFPYQVGLDSTIWKLVQSEKPGAALVKLKENRVAKFERTFPQAKRLRDAAREIAQAWFDGLSSDQRKWLSVKQNSEANQLALLDGKKIHDPQLATIARIAKQKHDGLLEKARSYNYLYEGELEFKDIEIDEDYPLMNLGSMRYGMTDEEKAAYKEHVYLYLNAVYASKQAQAQSTTDDGKETP